MVKVVVFSNGNHVYCEGLERDKAGKTLYLKKPHEVKMYHQEDGKVGINFIPWPGFSKNEDISVTADLVLTACDAEENIDGAYRQIVLGEKPLIKPSTKLITV